MSIDIIDDDDDSENKHQTTKSVAQSQFLTSL